MGETVDYYTQDPWKLFYKAYPRASQGIEEVIDLGQPVLAYKCV